MKPFVHSRPRSWCVCFARSMVPTFGHSRTQHADACTMHTQHMFQQALDSAGLTHMTVPFTGRSDYGCVVCFGLCRRRSTVLAWLMAVHGGRPFLTHGIPAGGLDTGAEVIKTVEQRAMFGGMANTPYDPCYHQVRVVQCCAVLCGCNCWSDHACAAGSRVTRSRTSMSAS